MKQFTLFSSVVLMLALLSSTIYAALPDDIVLYMAFDEGAGTTIRDSSKYGNNGVASAASWANAKYGKGFKFDAKTTTISVKASNSLTALKEPMSVGCWINPASFPGEWQCIIEMRPQAGAAGGWKLGIHNSNPTFTTYGVKDHFATGAIKTNEWTNIAATYDGKSAKFYINGKLDSEIAGQGAINVTTSPVLSMGAESGVAGTWAIDAIVDNLWVSNIVKSEKDIQQLMENQLAPVESSGKLSTTWSHIKTIR